MTASTGGNRNKPVRALADCRIGVAIVDDVVKDDAAIGMDRGVHFRHGAERGNDDRHLVFHAEAEIVFEPPVGAMDDLVDGKGR